MRVASCVLTTVAAVAILASPAAAQSASSAGQKYDVTFTMSNGTVYTGAMTVKNAAGKVTGEMTLTDPLEITGALAGTLKKDDLTLDYPYSVAGDQPCTGQVAIQAKFSPDHSGATGKAQTTGCGDPLEGSFELKKPAPKK